MGLSKKLKCKIGIGLLAIFSLGEVLGATKVFANDSKLKNLGTLEHYNAIVFGDHRAHTADVEGALAVGGNLTAPATSGKGYSIAAAGTHANNLIGSDYIENGMPSFLLGGELSKVDGGGLLTIEADTVVHKEGADKQNLVEGNAYRKAVIKSETEIKEKFKEFKDKVDFLSTNLKTLEKGEELKVDSTYLGDYLGVAKEKNIEGMLLSKIEGEKAEFGEIGLHEEVLNSKYWIIYSDAKEVNFKSGGMLYKKAMIDTGKPDNDFLHKVAPKILYVFPNATKVNLAGNGIVGSILAPNALTETKGGSVNGQLITNEFNQDGGFECHNFFFNFGDLIGEFKKASVEFKKVDSEDNNIPLEGAEFELYKKVNSEYVKLDGIYTSDSKGKIVINNLDAGDYRLTEIKSPNGYINENKNIDFTILTSETGTNIINKGNIENKKEVIVPEEKYGALKIIKKGEGNSLLKGAKFKLVDSKNNEYGPFESDEKGEIIFNDLAVGNYKLIEVLAPIGYEKLKDPIDITINEGDLEKVITREISNKEKLFNAQFKKIDVESNALEGAEFELYKKIDNEYIKMDGVYSSDSEGLVKINNLKASDYKLVEVKAPEGYKVLDKEILFTISPDEDNKEVIFKGDILNTKKDIVVPEEKYGALEIIKYEKDTEKVLKGAEFKLTGENFEEVKTTGENGRIKFENLKVGNYTLTETKAPEGFSILEKEIQIAIDENDLEKVKTKSVYNEKMIPPALKGDLKVLKVEEGTEKPLKGAEFSLTAPNGEVFKGISNDSGEIEFKNLESGIYILTETKAPEGFIGLKDPIKITIEVQKEGQVSIEQVTNKKKLFNAEFFKVDSENDKKFLEGAEFELYKKEGNEFKKLDGVYTSDSNGKVSFKDLEVGVYKFKETKAPDGYEIIKNEFNFVIQSNQNNEEVIKLEAVKNKKIEKPVVPEEKYGALEITKYEKDTEKVLKGAEFKLTGENFEEVKTTGEDGKIKFENLKVGNYTLTETKAPEGFSILEKEIQIAIAENDLEKVNKISVYNKKIEKPVDPPVDPIPPVLKGNLVIYKVEEGTIKPLKGAEFTLTSSKGEVFKGTSNFFGLVNFKNLESGVYTLTETKAPEGFIGLKDPIKINIDIQKEGQVIIKQVTNKKKLFNVQFKKVDSADNNISLEGAKFELYKKVFNQYIKMDGVYSSDSKGLIKINNLKASDYKLVEVKAPEGYKVLDKEILFTISPDEDNKEVIFKGDILNTKKDIVVPEEKYGALEITKYEKDTEKVLKGAEFKLTGENFEEVKTTGEDGKIKFENLKVGNYTLTETKAPGGFSILEKEIQIAIAENDLEKVKKISVYNKKIEKPVEPPVDPNPPVKPEDPKPPVKPEDPKPPVKPEDPKPVTKPEKPVIKDPEDNKLPQTGKEGKTVLYGSALLALGVFFIIKGKKN
ncbi:SpaA isopeptide-forming pilin-related protein [Clostridium sp. LY3-2]|uniref:SpaA isopeptide-forming pilin-related protein n=1 Tax=Clostridium sp. LY3-2 TaxID=2942482 RepID=UPI00215342AD|nr:SpaA isopeptide-forming pilin-related protein [Clostridium sp. LY3-2]MCR6516066.1 SpaA isopeptide-forming pilin-related protein [Clostridium sp. LY3-2]